MIIIFLKMTTETTENWKVIPICSKYEVSTIGRVRNKKTKRILKLQNENRCSKIRLINNDKKKKNYNVHRLVALTFIPNPENKPEVNFKDENPKNNKIENLQWVTKKENTDIYFKTAKKTYKKIKLTILKTKEEKIFNSIGECGKFIGYKHSKISHRLSGNVIDKEYKFELLNKPPEDMKNEVWKVIAEFPNYRCSNFGRIKNKNGLIIKSFIVNGFNSFCFRKNSKEYNKLIYTYIAKAFIPNPNNYKYVIHKKSLSDDNVNNLEWSEKRKTSHQDHIEKTTKSRRETYWNGLPDNIKKIIERLPYPNKNISYHFYNNYHIFRVNKKPYYFKTLDNIKIK